MGGKRVHCVAQHDISSIIQWYALLNGGLAMRIVSEPLLWTVSVTRVTLCMSAAAQLAAIVLFAFIAWYHVRAPSRTALV